MDHNPTNLTLGPCHLIAHITTKNDGSYEINSHPGAMRIFPATNENRYLNLGPTVQKLMKRRPFTFFQHPKHLDSIISGCIDSGNAHILQKPNTVVTWRGILTKIFLGEEVALHVSFVDGTLYIEEEDPKPEWRAKKYAFTDAVMKTAPPTWMAFEDVYTEPWASTSMVIKSSQKEHVDDQWCNVVQRSLGNLNLIFGGEVDAVKENDTGDEDSSHWFEKRIELKSRNVDARGSIKYARWHMQSSLLGVPEIFVGYRDNTPSLRVTRTRTIRTSDIQPTNFYESLRQGLEVLTALWATFESKREEEGDLDDTIWKLVIKKGHVKDPVKLSDVQAEKVKRRREVPQKASIARIGIVPKEIVSRLRESVKTT
ncbi:hypothetical protein L218DRAFT_981894 [Marasmius fiardii PR-910]|nr:hypothetical protein L218DRAFT_981894 [Marasmius fiardii PR-910]